MDNALHESRRFKEAEAVESFIMRRPLSLYERTIPFRLERTRDFIGGHYARVQALSALSGGTGFGDSDGFLISPGRTCHTKRQACAPQPSRILLRC